MPGIKTDDKISERLLSIDWGQPDSGRAQRVSNRQPAVSLAGQAVSVRIDEVFQHINAYRALVETETSAEGLLARSLISQANAVFNQAFVNLEKAHGFAKVYVDAPMGEHRKAVDITEMVIAEVLALQNILDA